MGLIFASCFNTATSGTRPSDAGVASALVNTGQQVGGALGTALLNTIAATVTASYLAEHGRSPSALSEAAVAGETRAFLVAAGVFALGAVLTLAVIPSGPNPVPQRGAPVPAGH